MVIIVTLYLCAPFLQLSDVVSTRLKEFLAGVDKEIPEYSTLVKVYSSYRSVRNIVALAVQPNVDLK